MVKSIAIETLGCKTNQFESAYILDNLPENFKFVNFDEFADIYIVNTCTVTQSASYQSRQVIRRAIRKNPNAIVIVTGCYAQVKPEEIENIEGVSYIFGNGVKDKILEVIKNSDTKIEKPVKFITKISKEDKFKNLRLNNFKTHTRAFIKIQDGCNRRCSFCIVPKARGKSRSLEPDEVIDQMNSFTKAGFKEIVITGIQLGDYGKDFKDSIKLIDLFKRIEEEVNINRIRISSLDPTDISEELIEFLSHSKKFCNHLHISLQSGDDEIIKLMRRSYTSNEVKKIINLCHEKISDLSIGMDIIAGFPGESEEHFRNTFNFLKDLNFTYLHVFPFSKREKTLAYNMLNQIEPNVIKERCRRLRELSKEKQAFFYKNHIGNVTSILVESERDNSYMLKGFSKNYIPIMIEGDDSLINKEVNIIVKEIKDGKVIGSLI